ncbi:MAG TPA: hypothetical protein VE029_04515 [Rhizobacter sp.]|nr:hypothetical protein [Rhizobacter sp.]
MRLLASFAAPAFCVCVAACVAQAPMAQTAPDSTPAASLRVLVKLTQPSDDADLIARRASASAGVAVRYVAAVSPQWHSLSLACDGEAACADALQRLRADAAYFSAVELDRKSRPLPSRP